MKWLTLLFCGAVLFGQQAESTQTDPSDAIQPDLTSFRYPALARAARVQGTVRFDVKDGMVHLISGHPMLAPAAKINLEKWALRVPDQEFEAQYTFVLSDIQLVDQVEPIGDSFDRFFLRLFRRPTNRTIKVCANQVNDEQIPHFHMSNTGQHAMIVITIEASVFCVETEVSNVAFAGG